jgi:hypothetical protein
MDIGALFPVLTLVLGWALNEMGSVLRLQREDRRAAGPVLTDLLEIRHRLVGLEAAMRRLGKEFQIPAQARVQLQQYIRALVPEPPRFVENYEEAVSTLARVDPVRAFRLRGKSLIGPFLAQVEAIAASDRAGSDFWSEVVEPKLLARAVPSLEELILDVARAHGWRTWWHARRHLRKPVLDRDFEEFVSDLVTEIKKKASESPPGT